MSSENVVDGVDTEGKQSDGVVGDSKEELVPKKELAKVLDELHSYKGRWKDTTAELEKIQSEFQSLKEKGAKSNEDYKALWEQTKQEATDWKGKYEGMQESFFYSEKYRSLLPKLKEMGLRDDAVQLLERENLKDVEVETTSQGRVLVRNAEEFAEKFRANYPFAFEQKKAPEVNSSMPGVREGKKWTPEALVKFEEECAKKGDMTPFYEAVKQWKKSKSS